MFFFFSLNALIKIWQIEMLLIVIDVKPVIDKKSNHYFLNILPLSFLLSFKGNGTLSEVCESKFCLIIKYQYFVLTRYIKKKHESTYILSPGLMY